MEAYKVMTKANLEGILDQVRNRLLEFLLGLQEVDPNIIESQEAIRAVPKEKVSNVFNYTIYGGNNVVASGTEFAQTVHQQVFEHDLQSLVNHFRSLGVSEVELVELRSALDEDGERPDRTLGKKVKAWIGNMTVKAVEGTWKVGLDTAPRLLTSGLSTYYGWN